MERGRADLRRLQPDEADVSAQPSAPRFTRPESWSAIGDRAPESEPAGLARPHSILGFEMRVHPPSRSRRAGRERSPTPRKTVAGDRPACRDRDGPDGVQDSSRFTRLGRPTDDSAHAAEQAAQCAHKRAPRDRWRGPVRAATSLPALRVGGTKDALRGDLPTRDVPLAEPRVERRTRG